MHARDVAGQAPHEWTGEECLEGLSHREHSHLITGRGTWDFVAGSPGASRRRAALLVVPAPCTEESAVILPSDDLSAWSIFYGFFTADGAIKGETFCTPKAP